MDITCPNCHTNIELVGAKEIKDEYKLSSNSVQYYRAERGFPDPVLKFGNRMVYLRKDVEAFAEKRNRRNVEKAVETLIRGVEHLPEAERLEAQRLLNEHLGGDGGTKPKTRTPRRK